MSILQRWYQRGWIRYVDLALAKTVQSTDTSVSEALLCALALCSRASADGHSALPFAQIQTYLQNNSVVLSDDDLQCIVQMARLNSDESTFNREALLSLQHDCLALRSYANSEQTLADQIYQRSQAKYSIDNTTTERVEQRFFSNDMNSQSIAEICRASNVNGLLLLTGGPGTGKTYSIARVIAFHLLQGNSRIALAAPTGKAAARLNASIQSFLQQLMNQQGLDAELLSLAPVAQTVHRLLDIRGAGRDPAYNARRRLPYDLIIIDEASMLDLPRMRALFEALPESSRVMLVGDPDQLPSVEAGNVMRSICDVSEQYPQQLKRIHLQSVFRQQSGSQIIALAQAVQQADADTAIELLRRSNDELHWHAQTERPATNALLNTAQEKYQGMLQASEAQAQLNAGHAYRVLCAEHAGEYGTRSFNRWIAQRMGHQVDDWFAGRWCLVERNDYQQNLFNGDLGLCVNTAQGLSLVFAGNDDTRYFNPLLIGDLAPAFAMTVHKAQGSEFDHVDLWLSDQSRYTLSREWLYTAITRARVKLHIYASEEMLRRAIAQPTQRWSSLPQRLALNYSRASTA